MIKIAFKHLEVSQQEYQMHKLKLLYKKKKLFRITETFILAIILYLMKKIKLILNQLILMNLLNSSEKNIVFVGKKFILSLDL